MEENIVELQEELSDFESGKRKLARYLRPDGNLTQPLPCDLYHKKLYLCRGFRLATEEVIQKEEILKPIKCPLCKQEQPNAVCLNEHITKEHINKSGTRWAEIGHRKCDECGKTFDSPAAYWGHLGSAHAKKDETKKKGD